MSKMGKNVIIYPGTRIGKNVSIEDNVVLGKQPVFAENSMNENKNERFAPLIIGDNCRIGTGTILYAGAEIGDNVTIADLATIRERVYVGEFTMVGRGVAIENNVVIGSHVKLQTNCYITAHSTIGNDVFIAPMVTFTNDNYMGRADKCRKEMRGPWIRRGARIGANSTLLPGIAVGMDALVAAGSVVTKDVPGFKVVMGVPAKIVRDVSREERL